MTWTGRVWAEYGKGACARGRVRVVCGFCRTRGQWRDVGDAATKAEIGEHAALCGAWYEFCDLWHRVAWCIGREAPWYWSSVHPPGICQCGHWWDEHRGGVCAGVHGREARRPCDCERFESQGTPRVGPVSYETTPDGEAPGGAAS